MIRSYQQQYVNGIICQKKQEIHKRSQSLNLNCTPTSYFNYGPRTLQVLQTRLRLECSSLNHHLSKKNIVDSAICSCGAIETAKHYLLICPNYTAVRNQVLSNYLNTPIKTLLSGDPLLNDDANQNISKAVQTFIERTKRFS